MAIPGERSTHFNGLAAGPSLLQRVSLSVSTTSGQIISVRNPEQQAVIITRALFWVQTVAGAAATLDIGVGTTSGDFNNLLTALDVHSATGVFDNIGTPGASGKSSIVMTQLGFVTVTVHSGDANGLVGALYLDYWLTAGTQIP